MKRRFLTVLMSLIVMVSFFPVLGNNAYALEDTGNATLNAFINDGRFTNGASWAWNKGPMLASFGSSGCCAYCADYVKYCYGINNPRSGAAFYNTSEIRAGDVLTVGNQSDGTGHWFICMKRSGNNLYVAEGNYSNKVRIGWNYTISGNKFAQDSRSFTAGYHYLDPFDPTQPTPQPISGGSQTVSDGDYHIVTAYDENMGLDVYENKGTDGNNVAIWHNTTDSKQVFSVKYLGDGFYSIQHKSTGKSLDADSTNNKNGQNLQIWNCNNALNQQWVIDDIGDGVLFSIRSRYNGLYLDADSGKSNDNTNVQLWEGNGSNHQKWKFVKIPMKSCSQTILDGDYQIVSALDNTKGIDIENAKYTNKTNVHLFNNLGDSRQVFTVKYENGYYTIRNKVSGMSLDVAYASAKLGTNIWIFDYNGSDSQKWVIKAANDSQYYSIFSKCNSLCLDVKDWKIDNGTNIQVWESNEGKAQLWKFIHVHTLVRTPAQPATMTAVGNIEYWMCSSCGKYYKDSAGKTEITFDQTVIPKLTNSTDPTITPGPQDTVISDLAAVKLVKPKAAKKSMTVKWKKVSKKKLKKIKKIQIQYSTDKTFKTGVKTKYAKAKKTSLKIKKLKSKKKYYVRIRAYTKSGNTVHVSSWSAMKSVKVK